MTHPHFDHLALTIWLAVIFGIALFWCAVIGFIDACRGGLN